jgi:hypothetical protein
VHALLESAQQQIVRACLAQRALQALRLFVVLCACFQRRVEQILGALLLTQLVGDTVQLEQDRALADARLCLGSVGARATEQEQERSIGAFRIL